MRSRRTLWRPRDTPLRDIQWIAKVVADDARELLQLLVGSADLAFAFLAFGDVASVQDDTVDERVVEQVTADRLDVSPLAVGGPKPILRSIDSYRCIDPGLKLLDDPLSVVGMDELERRLSHQCCRLESQNAPTRGTLVADYPAVVDHRDEIGRVFDEGLISLFDGVLPGNVSQEEQANPSAFERRCTCTSKNWRPSSASTTISVCPVDASVPTI